MNKLVNCDKVNGRDRQYAELQILVKKQDTGYFYYLVSCWHLFELEFILEFNLSLFPYIKSIKIL